MATHLVWFRADLRIHDNLALAAACRDPHAEVLGLFIATPGQWRQHGMAPRQAAFMVSHLHSLQAALVEKGIPLQIEHAEDFTASVALLASICRQRQVTHLFYNYQYEINERQRDAAVEKTLAEVTCQGFDDSVLLPPGSVLTGSREMYKVFTPFKNAFIRRLQEALPECVAAPKVRAGGPIAAASEVKIDYPQTPFDSELFAADEKSAIARLRGFCQQKAADYEQQRDLPAIEGTSRLSPCLAVGALSPRQCLHRLRVEQPRALDGEAGSVWLNELIWREFYRHLMVYYPNLCKGRPFIDWTDNVAWLDDKSALQGWQRGQTGFPIVDAAMRQLNATGWMHNRLRMIVASFLVKDLRIDWRLGERYFIEQLIDGDLAANNGGWQWAASTGTDAAPYFRIFNPTTQGERFDKAGQFIRQWLPELAGVPEKAVHQPWLWAEKQGVTLDYPRPIVDHKQARLATLAAWEAARELKTPSPGDESGS
ncbi:deoxyribodipyrimidine photo-lyase [Klebsiella michiganensis]|uniref:deoxyribodipyrimidine photo-lyase n=1 Tax=Klebsiella michiganensis TaxID=1134687 RepID=UPI00062C9D49|nr:deoxyribodipyrimidine photo-lyase [Klebsiella michiganensis]ELN3892483.1 deoxyribodipyrimidine photo-lyase [Klebsiella michiganensis]ELS5413080.1 deoxyribodipyrimidine photo-lyase [Klebsiella michiganensis]KKY64729.1 deoxyribodipyrimidine photolyase [Klebsiella michiganensis]MDU3690620.1 deoxyribodipyrimidine photo-lyase [Klebsiella michiganensis]MDU3715920.1 deoxyribodipyrimidine photo-lyase [Klebsiella michiganensis]